MFGVDPMSCDEGEEWDWNAMACVTAGQAVIPTPQLPPPQPMPLPGPMPLPPPPPPPTPAPAPPTFFQKYKTPILVVGAVVVAGALVYWISDTREATSNPGRKRPPKKWMRSCIKGVKKSGKAKDPGAVCGSQWYKKMSPAKRRAAKKRSYGR